MEIHPSLMYGFMGNQIVYPENNPLPRNAFACGQAKQAVSTYSTNFISRIDKMGVMLNYGQIPIVKSRYLKHINNEEHPCGENVIVAIMCYSGYNVEDSILFNEGSVKRGMFRTTYFNSYETREESAKDKGVVSESRILNIEKEANVGGLKPGYEYDHLDMYGMIKENTELNDKIVLIGKVKSNSIEPDKQIDDSVYPKKGQLGFVDKTFITENEEGTRLAKVRIREERMPNIGDKFASRAGQKGTVGNIIPEEDMPFTASGDRPDIIINPHAIPSRMTIGQLKETLLGEVLVKLGLFGDGTSFGELTVDEISKKLLELGHECHGNKLLDSGLTGEQIECSIFMGPVFYQRLKHMVNDKHHSRSVGRMVNLTRQPAEGRSRDGGLRFGEMEKDAMVSHGASRFTRERMYDVSDKYHVYICKKCGLVASYNNELHIHCCKTCDNRVDFAYVEIPYACKLLFQELTTMNVVPRIITENV